MKIAQKAVVAAAAATFAVAGMAAPALAHHSFAMFDQQAQKSLSGTVQQFDWTNPHTFIWLEVQNGAKTERWGIEGMSPNYLARRGWSKTTLTAGDKVTITFHPLKDGSTGGSFMKLVLANGKEMTMIGGG